MQEFPEYLKQHPSVTKYGDLAAREELQSKSYDPFFKWIGDFWDNRETTAKLKTHCRSIIEQWENPNTVEYVPESVLGGESRKA